MQRKWIVYGLFIISNIMEENVLVFYYKLEPCNDMFKVICNMINICNHLS